MRQQPSAPVRERRPFSDALLCVSACVLATLITLRLLGGGGDVPRAEALPLSLAMMSDSAINAGDFTLLTFNAASNEDVLAVLDSRSERLFAYGIENQRSITLLDNQKLQDIFEATRRMGAGRP